MSDIVINGNAYNGVETISVKTTGGGTATYTDNATIKEDITAIESKVTKLETVVSGKASTDYVDTKVADLVNSAPETLDTLGEVAQAIAENESVVEALNSAIGSKANQEDLTALDGKVETLEDKVTQLEESGGSGGTDSSKNFIYLTGTEENPINLYTDLELGKGYILNGYIRYSDTKSYSTGSYHIFAYKKMVDHIILFNSTFSSSSISFTQNNIISGVSVYSSGNFKNSMVYTFPEKPTEQNKILSVGFANALKWSSLADLTEFSDLATRVETLENTPGGSVDLSNYYTKDETDALFVTGGSENLLKLSPVEIPANSTENLFVDSDGNNYELDIEIGKTYEVEYIVEGVTYKQETGCFDVEGSKWLGTNIDYNSGEIEHCLTFTGSDGVTYGLAIAVQSEMGTAALVFNVESFPMSETNPALTLVSIKEAQKYKYALTDSVYTKNQIDTMLGDISTLLDDINGEVV